jgi:hypothetical protein
VAVVVVCQVAAVRQVAVAAVVVAISTINHHLFDLSCYILLPLKCKCMFPVFLPNYNNSPPFNPYLYDADKTRR